MSLNEWSRFVVNILSVVSWPLLTLFVVIKFGTELKGLIKHIKSISYPGGKVDTRDRARQSQEEESPQVTKKIEKLNDENKKLKDSESLLRRLHEDVTKDREQTFLKYHLERTFRLIFGSQIKIVQHAYTNGKVSEEVARSIYNETLWLSSYNYENYMGFLINSGLLSHFDTMDNSYSILPVGRAFIEFLMSEVPGFWNKQPY